MLSPPGGYVFKGEQCYKIISGRKDMNKYPLIGGSICAVVLLVLASLMNVVGYQTVQASNQKIMTTELSEKDLLFQTIVDMANNKEIQRVILGSELTSKRFFDSSLRLSVYTPQVLTKRFLNFAYNLGLIFSKTISESKIKSMLKQYQVNNPGLQKEITTIIDKDTILKSEMTQLLSLKCDCNEENNDLGPHPILCALLNIITLSVILLVPELFFVLVYIFIFFYVLFQCQWIPEEPHL
jgi:hypothetical protein